jgi:hypothetical protein
MIKNALNFYWSTTPIGQVINIADKYLTDTHKPNVSITELEQSAMEAKITAEVLTNQAKVQQEQAIATRILLAEVVEIEEYYDISGQGNLGLSADGASETITLGASLQGKKISKRVIKFSGFNNNVSEETLNNMMLSQKSEETQ